MPEVDGSYLVARTLKEENTECLFYLMGGPNYEIINNCLLYTSPSPRD